MGAVQKCRTGIKEEMTNNAIARLEAIASRQGSAELSAVVANMKNGHIVEAEPVYRSIADTYAATRGVTDELKVQAYLDLAAVNLYSERERAVAALEKALAISPNAPAALAFLAYMLFEGGAYPQAKPLYQKLMSLEASDENAKWRAIAAENLGIIHQISGDLKSAELCYELAIDTFRQMGDDQRLAECLGNHGLIHRRKRRLSKAREMFTEALSIWREREYESEIVRMLGYLASIHFMEGELDEAIELFLERVQINETLEDIAEMAADNANLGLAFSKKGKRESACRHWQEAMSLYEKAGRTKEMEQLSALVEQNDCA